MFLKHSNKLKLLISIAILSLVAFIILPAEICLGEGNGVGYTKLRYNFYGLEFIDSSHGWIAGRSGYLYHTRDGGLTWEKQQSGTDFSIFGISFVDRQTGWAVGQGGLILFTDNGGVKWSAQNSPDNKSLFCVKFINAQHGIAAGDWGKILLTNDGGKKWMDVSFSEDIVFYDVKFVTEQEVWIVGEAGNMLHSFDGGKSWKKIQVETSTFFAISFDKKGKGVAVGLDGKVVNTADGGKSWKSQSICKESLYNVILADGSGLAVGDAGTLFETKEPYTRWNEIQVPTDMKSSWLQAVAYLGKSRFVVGGKRGSIRFVEHSQFVKP